MNLPEQMAPLHDRLIVRHLERKKTDGLIVIRDNPHMLDFIGDGKNGEHNDNRRVGVVSRIVSVGETVRGLKKGETILHTAWNDFADCEEFKGYAMIREGDVWGHYDAKEEYQS